MLLILYFSRLFHPNILAIDANRKWEEHADAALWSAQFKLMDYRLIVTKASLVKTPTGLHGLGDGRLHGARCRCYPNFGIDDPSLPDWVSLEHRVALVTATNRSYMDGTLMKLLHGSLHLLSEKSFMILVSIRRLPSR